MNSIPKIGEKLKNGAMVLACRVTDENMLRTTVLAFWDGNPTPFVTWRLGADSETYLGHYYTSLGEAWADFTSR